MEVLLSSLAILLYTFAFAAAAAERQSRRKQKREPSPSPVLDVSTKKKKKKMRHRSSQPAIGKLGDGPGSPEGSEEGQPETSAREEYSEDPSEVDDSLGSRRVVVQEKWTGGWECPACQCDNNMDENYGEMVVAECSTPGCRFTHPLKWNRISEAEDTLVKPKDVLCPICGCHKSNKCVKCPRCSTLSTGDDAKRKEWEVLMPMGKHYVHAGTSESLDKVRERTNVELKESISIQQIMEVSTFRGLPQFIDGPHPNWIKTEYHKKAEIYNVRSQMTVWPRQRSC